MARRFEIKIVAGGQDFSPEISSVAAKTRSLSPGSRDSERDLHARRPRSSTIPLVRERLGEADGYLQARCDCPDRR